MSEEIVSNETPAERIKRLREEWFEKLWCSCISSCSVHGINVTTHIIHREYHSVHLVVSPHTFRFPTWLNECADELFETAVLFVDENPKARYLIVTVQEETDKKKLVEVTDWLE